MVTLAAETYPFRGPKELYSAFRNWVSIRFSPIRRPDKIKLWPRQSRRPSPSGVENRGLTRSCTPLWDPVPFLSSTWFPWWLFWPCRPCQGSSQQEARKLPLLCVCPTPIYNPLARRRLGNTVPKQGAHALHQRPEEGWETPSLSRVHTRSTRGPVARRRVTDVEVSSAVLSHCTDSGAVSDSMTLPVCPVSFFSFTQISLLSLNSNLLSFSGHRNNGDRFLAKLSQEWLWAQFPRVLITLWNLMDPGLYCPHLSLSAFWSSKLPPECPVNLSLQHFRATLAQNSYTPLPQTSSKVRFITATTLLLVPIFLIFFSHCCEKNIFRQKKLKNKDLTLATTVQRSVCHGEEFEVPVTARKQRKVHTWCSALFLHVCNPRFHPGNGDTPVGRLSHLNQDNPPQTLQRPILCVALDRACQVGN